MIVYFNVKVKNTYCKKKLAPSPLPPHPPTENTHKNNKTENVVFL
jgi:hypothetical protein